ncbi:MAG: hypothetical protein R3E68_10210 [Burkholderiaceae bacterium]
MDRLLGITGILGRLLEWILMLLVVLLTIVVVMAVVYRKLDASAGLV